MKRLSLILALVALTAACSRPQPQAFHVIPMPEDVTLGEGVFPVAGAAIQVDENIDPVSVKAIQRFRDAVETASGKPLRDGNNGFHFILNPNLAAEQ